MLSDEWFRATEDERLALFIHEVLPWLAKWTPSLPIRPATTAERHFRELISGTYTLAEYRKASRAAEREEVEDRWKEGGDVGAGRFE